MVPKTTKSYPLWIGHPFAPHIRHENKIRLPAPLPWSSDTDSSSVVSRNFCLVACGVWWEGKKYGKETTGKSCVKKLFFESKNFARSHFFDLTPYTPGSFITFRNLARNLDVYILSVKNVMVWFFLVEIKSNHKSFPSYPAPAVRVTQRRLGRVSIYWSPGANKSTLGSGVGRVNNFLPAAHVSIVITWPVDNFRGTVMVRSE